MDQKTRFDKISNRKPRYNLFSKHDGLIIKNYLDTEEMRAQLNRFWRITAVYKIENGRKVADQKKTDWTNFYYLDKRIESLVKRGEKLMKHRNMSDEERINLVGVFRQDRGGYGGSF